LGVLALRQPVQFIISIADGAEIGIQRLVAGVGRQTVFVGVNGVSLNKRH
jgi:hypothetical protein